jgi:hypothetical protein
MNADIQTNNSGEQAACPAQQMSFADITRYLQGGFDEPVQRALAQHVRFCNGCQEMIERVAALRRTGHQNMVTRVAPTGNSLGSRDENDGGGGIPETLLAAFIDDRLPSSESRQVGSAVGASYANYVQFAAAKSELSTPPGTRYLTPRHAMDAMMVPEYQHEAVRVSVTAWADRMADAFSSFLALRWPAPAAAFALGMLLMLAVLPAGETIIALPGFADEIGQYDDSHVRSGIEEPVQPEAVAVPVHRSKRISFSWQRASYPEPVTYRVDLADAEGNAVGTTVETENDFARIDARNLEAGRVYTVSVMAKLPNGGLMPVSNQAFRIVEND